MTAIHILFESERAARAASPILAGRTRASTSNLETVWHGIQLFEVVVSTADDGVERSDPIESVLRDRGFVAREIGGSKVWRLPRSCG